MAELKTKPTKRSVDAFLKKQPEDRRNDCYKILEMMRKVTKCDPVMWGESIVGFDQYHYKYKSGQEGDWMVMGFSPRKANISLYLMCNFKEFEDLMPKLGKYKNSVGCLYIKKLEDIDTKVLEKMFARTYKLMKTKYK